MTRDGDEQGGHSRPEGPAPYRAGFAVLAGQPNVGKSTLLNALLGEKVAIVSRKPQTTRTRILGVYQAEGLQIAFLDTPGIHSPRGGSRLNEEMVAVALATIEEVDACVLVIDVKRALHGEGARVSPGDRDVVSRLKRARRPTALVINKIDEVPRDRVLHVIDAYRKLHDFEVIYPLSALTGEGIQGLPAALAPLLPESEPLFPADVLTDQAERILAAEYVREQVLNFTHAEVPYGVAVEVRQFDESERESRGEGLIRVHADIIVERPSHKGIVIGQRGAMLRRIGTAARKNLERLLGARVWLGLHVRVEKDWTKRPGGLRRFS
ncbi:MAG: GTPase Era [Myxococcota bacterium]